MSTPRELVSESRLPRALIRFALAPMTRNPDATSPLLMPGTYAGYRRGQIYLAFDSGLRFRRANCRELIGFIRIQDSALQGASGSTHSLLLRDARIWLEIELAGALYTKVSAIRLSDCFAFSLRA